MKKIFAVLIVVLFTMSSYAQLNLVGSLGMGGGIVSGYLNPSLKDLNSELTKAGLKEFDAGLFGFGGGGGLIMGNIRLGGYGIGGSKQVSTNRKDNQNNSINSITKLDYGYGVGYIGYNILSFDDFHLSIDLGIGGGSVELQIIDKSTDEVNFGDALKPFGVSSNRANTLEMNFFTYQPSIVAEYVLSGFVKIFVAGDYIGTISGDWKMDDEFNLTNVPKLKFDGFTIRAGIYLGIFL